MEPKFKIGDKVYVVTNDIMRGNYHNCLIYQKILRIEMMANQVNYHLDAELRTGDDKICISEYSNCKNLSGIFSTFEEAADFLKIKIEGENDK